MLGLGGTAYFIVYLLGSVLVFLLGILLPIMVIFLHASMRLRNMKNKLMNKMEYLGIKKTPMGVILDALGLEQEFLILNMDSPNVNPQVKSTSKIFKNLTEKLAENLNKYGEVLADNL